MLGFTTDAHDKDSYRAELKAELALMRQEYRTLLYGGPMLLQVCMLASTFGMLFVRVGCMQGGPCRAAGAGPVRPQLFEVYANKRARR